MTIKKVGFLKLTTWDKINYTVFFVGGIGLTIYAVCEFTGFLFEVKLRRMDGQYFVVPPWMLGMFALGGAYIAFFMAHMVRTKFVDRREERFKVLLQEVEDDLRNLWS